MEVNLPVTYAPHPILAKRENRSVLWESGRTIREHLVQADVDVHQEIVVFHNGRLLKAVEWDVICPQPGDLLNVEGVVSGGDGDSNPIATILSIAVMEFAPALGAALNASLFAAESSLAFVLSNAALGAVIAIGGNLLISSLFRPSQASAASSSIGTESPTYSLSGGSNRMRPYEPLPVVMGNHRIFPDYGSKPYTEFSGDDQYLYQVFNFGLGDLILSDLRIGETLLSTYSGVEITRAENGVLPGFWGNVDSAEGAALSNATGWVTRTTGTDTTQIAIDLVGTFYYANKKGGLNTRSAAFEVEYSVAGAGSWQPFIPTGLSAVTSYWSRGYWQNTITDPYYDGGNFVPGSVIASTWVQVAYDTNVSPSAHVENADGGSGTLWRYVPVGADPRPADSYATSTNALTLSGASTKPQRRTVSRAVPSGQYDVRVRRTSADETDSKASSSVEWTVMRSYQEGVADYTGQTVLGIKIKASGQLNGALQQLSAHAVQNTYYWDGSAWAFGPTTNPAWWYLNLARGYRDADGALLYGGGLEDAQIDLEAIKAWAVFCDANGLSFSAVFDRAQTLADALQTITRCGFASPSWASGKLGVVWDAPNQAPVMAFGMANIIKGSFEVSYVTDNLADEIVVNYDDRNKNWDPNQVRVTVPGTVGTPVKPSTVDLMGCTTNAMAAKFANALAAQQVYRRRNITWETDFEGFVCQRGDVVILSHDLTQWGYSGRLVAVAGNVVTLSKPVPRSGETDYLMIQSPDGETELIALAAGSGETDTLTLPGVLTLQSGYAAVDHKWYFSPLPTPGKKVKITSVQPLSESRLRLTATDEYPEYYAAWNGVFTPPPTQTQLTPGSVSLSHLSLTLNAMVVDNFQINRVTVSWRQRGEIESCTLVAWLDGMPYGTWTGIKDASHIIDLSQQTGTLIVEVTPIGVNGPGAALTGSLNLSTLPAPEAPVLTVTGGLFAVNATWTFGDEREDIRATEIWFASTNNRANAVRLTAEPFPVTEYNQVGMQPGSGGYYWARVMDTRENYSTWYPVGASSGLYAEASTDPSLLLDQLQAALGMDQLAAELATPISLIEAPDSTPGSVNSRIKNAQDALQSQIKNAQDALQSQIKNAQDALQSQINELSNTPLYDNATAYAADDIVQYDGGLYKATQATTGNLPTNTTYWTKIGDYTSLADIVADHTAKIDAINTVSSGSTSAVAQAVAGLQTDITAAEGTISTHSTQISDRYTKAQTDSAISSASSTLTAAYQAADTTTLNSAKAYSDAAINTEQTTRASADSALATRATNLETSVNSPTTGLATKASIAYVDQAEADAVAASAASIAQVSARLDSGDYAAVKTSAAASANKITGLEAKWVLQVDANGKVAGMSLASGANGTAIAMLADKFLLYKPDGTGAPKQVFSIGTVNGVQALGFDGSAIFDGSVVAQKIDTRGLSIKDASGNVILAAGTSLPIKYLQHTGNVNLLDTSTWTVNSHDGCTGFTRNGGKFEQYRYNTVLPDGSIGIVWKCWPQLYYNSAYGWDAYLAGGEAAGNADGGWNTDVFSINSLKTYRFVVFVRREGGSTGNTYLGCRGGTVRTMPGNVVDSNPYFSVGNVPVDGNWYLIVGYVYPETSAGASQPNRGGIWSCKTGQKIAAGTDFVWAAGATSTYHRAFLYYSAVGCLQEFAWPRVDVCDGNEPSLDELLSSGAVSARNQINAANISTYIAAAAIDYAQIKDAAIRNANIQNASVDTLKIAGNAVTIQQTASGGSSASIYHSCSGGSVIIIAECSGQQFYSGESGYYGTMNCSLTLDGTTLVTAFGSSNPDSGNTHCVLAWIVNPSAAGHTFRVSWSNVASGSCRIAILEAKR